MSRSSEIFLANGAASTKERWIPDPFPPPPNPWQSLSPRQSTGANPRSLRAVWREPANCALAPDGLVRIVAPGVLCREAQFLPGLARIDQPRETREGPAEWHAWQGASQRRGGFFLEIGVCCGKVDPEMTAAASTERQPDALSRVSGIDVAPQVAHRLGRIASWADLGGEGFR